MVKNTPANAADIGGVHSVPGLGRYRGKGHGNPLQYSGLENPMDRGAWGATVHGVTKGQIGLKWQHARTLMWHVLQDSSVHLWSKISIFFLLVLRLVFSLSHAHRQESELFHLQPRITAVSSLSLSLRLQASICRPQSQVQAGFMDLGGISTALITNFPGCMSSQDGRQQKKKWGLGWSGRGAESWRGWGQNRGCSEFRAAWKVCLCVLNDTWGQGGEENGKGLFDWVIFETFLSIAQSV